MAAQHEFSPIVNSERLDKAVEYVAEQSLILARTVLLRELSIDTICFFARSNREYAVLEAAVHARGPESKFSHGATLYVDTNFIAAGQQIRLFGVRQPDPTRPWVGYGDYPVADFEQLTKDTRDNPYVTPRKSGQNVPLLELCHPDLDVLGFVVAERDHK